jgi:hypothetical protein
MTKLNQVIAIEKDVKNHAHKIATEAHKLVQKPALFDGLYKTYQKKDEDGDDLPAERKHVQLKVADLLKSVKAAWTHLIDVTVQKDMGNARATANLTVDGQIVFPNVPVTTLLFLEKQVTDHRSLISALPVLDIAEEWEEDKNESNFYRAAPTSTHRSKKVQKPLVLYHATPEHAAQTAIVSDDIVTGFWHTEKVSGAIPKKVKERMLQKADKLLLAIKEAREAANDIEVGEKVKLGHAVYAYLEG